MKKPYPPVPVRQILQSKAEEYRVFQSKEPMDKKLLCDTLSFSVGLQERLVMLLPDGPCVLAGSWHGRPPSDSADAVLWKVAALVKYDPETRGYPVDDFRPLVNRIAEHLNIDDDDGWRLFSKSHEKVQAGIGAANQHLQVAKLNAQQDIDQKCDVEYYGKRRVYRNPQRRLLLGIHRYLLRGGKPGERFLSTRAAGALIDVNASTAGEWIKAMVRDGYLEKLADSTEFSATRYRWIDC